MAKSRKRSPLGPLLAGLTLGAAVGLGAWYRPAFTPPAGVMDGGRSVAALEKVRLNGSDQWVLIRGADRAKPIVLILTGRPEDPQIPFARDFGGGLEKDFVTVQWDRRGRGKSYDPANPPKTLSAGADLRDAAALVRWLRGRFGPQPVIVLGQDYGARLGIALAQAHPELVRAYVAIGQPACTEEDEHAVQDSWLKGRAERVNDTRTVLKAVRGGDWDRRKALYKYGGALSDGAPEPSLALAGVSTPEYSLAEAIDARAGETAARTAFVNDAPKTPLAESIPAVQTPVFFFLGAGDYVSPRICSERYASGLLSPVKRVVWFRRSAHFPQREEPELFAAEMAKVAQATAGPAEGG